MQPVRSRREFLRISGMAAGVWGLGGLLQACGGAPAASAPPSSAPPASPAAAASKPAVASASAKPATSGAASASAKPAASGSAAAKPAASAAGSAAAKPGAKALRVTYGSPVGSFAPLWMAKEIGAFDKYGINVEMSLLETNNAMAAMIGNQIDLMEVSMAPVITADVNGNVDVKLVASALNHPILALYADSSIKNANDLKGKVIASDKPGTPVDYSAQLSLSLLGLKPSDVNLRPIGTSAEITAALLSGQVPAGMEAPPQSFQVETKGFHLLQDIFSKPYQNVGLMTRMSRFDELGPQIKQLLLAYRDGIAAIFDQSQKAKQVFDQYAKIGDADVINKTYDFYTKTAPFQRDLQPTMEGIQAMIDFLAATVPAVKGHKAEEFVDLRFVKDLPKA
jgi:NitT/TauT family transport system substrate-binding protein